MRENDQQAIINLSGFVINKKKILEFRVLLKQYEVTLLAKGIISEDLHYRIHARNW